MSACFYITNYAGKLSLTISNCCLSIPGVLSTVSPMSRHSGNICWILRWLILYCWDNARKPVASGLGEKWRLSFDVCFWPIFFGDTQLHILTTGHGFQTKTKLHLKFWIPFYLVTYNKSRRQSLTVDIWVTTTNEGRISDFSSETMGVPRLLDFLGSIHRVGTAVKEWQVQYIVPSSPQPPTKKSPN